MNTWHEQGRENVEESEPEFMLVCWFGLLQFEYFFDLFKD